MQMDHPHTYGAYHLYHMMQTMGTMAHLHTGDPPGTPPTGTEITA